MTTVKTNLKEFVLGIDKKGEMINIDLNHTPHILIAGSTGSGKSNFIHYMLGTLLAKNTPKTLKLILVDTKLVELTLYENIPNLLEAVITSVDEILPALDRLDKEINSRLIEFRKNKVRNIEEYNSKSSVKLPSILLVIDELADLLTRDDLVSQKLIKIINVSRATGMHLILATQRPSSDVIPGNIKANISCRIAFKTSSNVDSHVILGQGGAELLNTIGDVLYKPVDQDELIAAHTPLMPIESIKKIIQDSKNLAEIKTVKVLEELIPESYDLRIIGTSGNFKITRADYLMCMLAITENPERKLVKKSFVTFCMCSTKKAEMVINHMVNTGFLEPSSIVNEYIWNKEISTTVLNS